MGRMCKLCKFTVMMVGMMQAPVSTDAFTALPTWRRSCSYASVCGKNSASVDPTGTRAPPGRERSSVNLNGDRSRRTKSNRGCRGS